MNLTNRQLAKILFHGTSVGAEEKIDMFIKNFLDYLRIQKRKKDIGKIIRHYLQIYDQRHNIVRAEVVGKNKLDSKLKEEIRDFIKSKIGKEKEVMMREKKDENMLGGFVLNIGNQIWDFSLDKRLKELKKLIS